MPNIYQNNQRLQLFSMIYKLTCGLQSMNFHAIQWKFCFLNLLVIITRFVLMYVTRCLKTTEKLSQYSDLSMKLDRRQNLKGNLKLKT